MHRAETQDRARGGVVFIIPQLPPAVCGLGDYSMHLLANLNLGERPRILVANGAAETDKLHPELGVGQLERTASALVRKLEEMRASHVVLEYVGYGYQSRCCPLWLLDGLRKWKRRNPAGRLLLMLMELWFTPAWWKPDFLLQRLHRHAMRKLVATADKVFVSTEGWASLIRDCVPPGGLRIVPVGTNVVPVAPPGSVPRKPGRWILFGRQGSRIFALRGLAPWLSKLHASGMVRMLQVAGARENDDFNRTEDALLAGALPPDAYQILGRMPGPELSRLLLEAEAGLFGQPLGAFSKSTIFMTYASHGMNIVALNVRGITDPPICWVTEPAEFLEPDADIGRLLAERSAKLSRWFEETASWSRIASIYLQTLGLGSDERKGQRRAYDEANNR